LVSIADGLLVLLRELLEFGDQVKFHLAALVPEYLEFSLELSNFLLLALASFL
jgi:hypothetical protein